MEPRLIAFLYETQESGGWNDVIFPDTLEEVPYGEPVDKPARIFSSVEEVMTHVQTLLVPSLNAWQMSLDIVDLDTAQLVRHSTFRNEHPSNEWVEQ